MPSRLAFQSAQFVSFSLSLCIGVGAFESVSLSVLANGITSYARVGRKDLSATAAKSTNARTGGTGRGKSGDTREIGSFTTGAGTLDCGPYLNDFRKIFGFLDPCPHLILICRKKFTQPPFLHIIFRYPTPSQCRRHLSMVPSLASISCRPGLLHWERGS